MYLGVLKEKERKSQVFLACNDLFAENVALSWRQGLVQTPSQNTGVLHKAILP